MLTYVASIVWLGLNYLKTLSSCSFNSQDISAYIFKRNIAVVSFLYINDASKGVKPRGPTVAFTFAPLTTSYLTTSTWPSCDAKWSGAYPLSSIIFMFAPLYTNSTITSK